MRICLDARWIFPEISGIGHYTRELIRHFAQLHSPHEFILLFSDPALRDRTLAETGTAQTQGFSTVLFPHGVFSPSSQILLPRALRRMKADVYHSTNFMIPLLAFSRNGAHWPRCVTTIHDVIPMLFPDHAPRSRKARLYPLYRWLMCEIGRRSDLIVTVSRTSARDIIRQLRFPLEKAGKVVVIPNGVSTHFQPAPLLSSSAERHSILYVGRMDPYKNISTLIQAFAQVRKSSRFPVELVIAGSPDPRYPEAMEEAVRLGIADAIRWTGYLTDEQLLALYHASTVLVHPSRYEGFGLQILEAMACGLPVICSKAGSLEEVAGDAALLVAPDDGNGFAQQILHVLENPEKAAQLRAKGLARAQEFSWRRTAVETLQVYETLTLKPAPSRS